MNVNKIRLRTKIRAQRYELIANQPNKLVINHQIGPTITFRRGCDGGGDDARDPMRGGE